MIKVAKSKRVDCGKGTHGIRFYCPGCKENHVIPIDGPKAWQWNQSFDNLTLKPSIKVSGVRMMDKGKADCQAWCDAGYPKPAPERFETEPRICHSFVTNGNIQFLNDCTHDLKGQTLELPEIN